MRIKHLSKRPPCNHSTMSPGPVQCRCPVSTADRTGITLTACLKHMAHWQKIHISSRATLFSISQNWTKPQIPLGRAFGFFIQWLRSNTFVCGTWRLLLPTWQAQIPHASSRNTGKQGKVCTAWWIAGSWDSENFCGTAHVLTWFLVFFGLLVFFNFCGFVCGFFPHPFLQA